MLGLRYLLPPLGCVLLIALLGCSGEPEVQEFPLESLPADQLVFEHIKNGDTEALGLLLDQTPDFVNLPGSSNNTPLHSAAGYGNADVVKMLLERGADPTATNDFGQTPLDIAKLGKKSDIVKLLEGQ
ncbi:MAG: ankyrin repeat domain-containing protein [Candidatus Hydrogenedentes bacterium]|nr:ankyrin repeat domain-containing protein [Candidatus Hydrogenedentota bacterium]